jgi:RNA polymerase sigma factor (TIGR02999 family)
MGSKTKWPLNPDKNGSTTDSVGDLMAEDSGQVTDLLKRWGAGDRAALDELMPVMHRELRRLAAYRMQQERPEHSLQPTALVNEMFLRIVDLEQIDWQDRAHFLATASAIMRRILVDHARRHRAAKRGKGVSMITLNEAIGAGGTSDVEVLALDEALSRLGAMDERLEKVVVLRFFGGLTVDEISKVLEVSAPTVKRDWSTAKTWLYRELSEGG